MRLNIAIIAAAATLVAAPLAADTYVRKDTQDVNVVDKDGKLYCTRVADGYEMCNGMTKSEDGKWRGKNMRHPDMPSFMKFNGTVTFTTAGLNIQGCALGICDAENWTKK